MSVVGRADAVGQGALFYSLPVFPLGEAGFPATFSVMLFGQSGYESTNLGGPLGIRTLHSFAPSLIYIQGIVPAIRVWTEGGAVIPFKEFSPGLWRGQDERVATLTVSPLAGCTGTIVAQLGDGTRYTFGESGPAPCSGAAKSEGRIQRTDRPNGDWLTFTADSNGYIGTVTNRRGATVTLSHAPEGSLQKVTMPGGDVVKFVVQQGLLRSIERVGVTQPLWTLTYAATGGGSNQALVQIKDAKDNLEHAWTYTDSNANRIATEQGPGSNAGNTLTYGYPSTTQTTVTFTDSQAVTKTNTVTYATQMASGSRPRAGVRTIQGKCPGCGSASDEVGYWTSTAWARTLKDANGYFTVFEDLANPGVLGAAYDSGGNSKVVYEGCNDPAVDPGCAAGRRTSFTYQPGTRVIASSTRPSVMAGATVTDSRTFDGASSRPVLARRQGRTAAALDGVIGSTPITLTTRNTYGGGLGGTDVTLIEGPFLDDGTGTPPSTAPRTQIGYYGATTVDACSSLVVSTNSGRAQSVTRVVSEVPLVQLVTSYCAYDGAGRPRKIKGPTGAVTELTYDFRGNVTKTIVDAGSGRLNLTTETSYDANGNLSEIRLPRTEGSARTGVRYSYDSADRLIMIERGSFDTTSGVFTAIEWMAYALDAWGNRTITERRDSVGSVVVSEGAKYDAFNRLVELTRPAGSTPGTTFSYDARGNVSRVGDAQGDDVFYGSVADPQSFDRFGKLSLVREEVCAHPVTDPNGSCTDATPAEIQYGYDPALQLAQVTVQDAIRGGSITTSYTADDFGQIVKVVSPDSGTSYFRYDGAGRLFESLDARGKKFQFQYDRTGRLTAKINVTGTPVTEVRYCYDGFDAACGYTDAARFAGSLTSVDDKPGSLFFEYDGAGRMTSESRKTGPSTTFLSTWTYDANGNIRDHIQPNGLVIRRTRDLADRVSRMQWSTIAVDPLLSGFSGDIVQRVEWFPFGELKAFKSEATGSRGVTITKDTAGRTTNIRMANSANTTLKQLSYNYGADGNVLGVYEGTAINNIAHDSLSRVTQDRGPSGGTRLYSYDDAGNRTLGPTGTFAFASTSSDRITSDGTRTHAQDATGNTTTRGTATLGMADDGTVTSIVTGSGTTTYERDYRNLRFSKSGAGGASTYFYGQAGEMTQWTGPVSTSSCFLPNFQQSTQNTIPYENFVYVGGKRVGMVKSHASTSCGGSSYGLVTIDEVYNYFADSMDLPRAVYRTTGSTSSVWSADFDAFGNPLATPSGTLTQSFRLPGQFALTAAEGGPSGSQGGLHENWNRVYDSSIGRYLERDPKTSFDQPYAYAENKPFMLQDRRGLTAATAPADWLPLLPSLAPLYPLLCNPVGALVVVVGGAVVVGVACEPGEMPSGPLDPKPRTCPRPIATPVSIPVPPSSSEPKEPCPDPVAFTEWKAGCERLYGFNGTMGHDVERLAECMARGYRKFIACTE